jgi:intracellular multiplication protein IcmO
MAKPKRNPGFGIDNEYEIPTINTLIKHRTFWQRYRAYIDNPRDVALTCIFVGFLGVVPAIAPYAPLALIVLSAAYFLTPVKVSQSGKSYFPMRAPAQDGRPEFKQLGMDDSGTQKGTGIFYMGTEIMTGREVWLSNEDVREHFWITGTTGAGKSELIMGMIMNCLTWGSGCVMIDGKGDIKTAIKIWQMCRIMGLTDNFLLLNFMVPKRKTSGSGKITHKMNPFANQTKEEIMTLIGSLLPKASGDGAAWQSKAIVLMTGIVGILVWLRDTHGKPLTAQSIQEGMVLDNILRVLLPNEICNPLYRDMPPEVRTPLLNYANNLSSFPRDLLQMPPDGSPHPLAKPGTPYKFVDQTNTQHGFLTSILGPPLALLGNDYRDIFSDEYPDIDIFDVVLNRRILVAILPATQKTLEEMGSLGKLIVSAAKGMIGDSLGFQFEGTVSRTKMQSITAAPSPFMMYFDEWTYYITPGAAMMPAQGRGLGFAFVFAVQSLTAVFKRDDVEARDAFGTVNTRIFMFAVDEETTIKSAIESAGKGETMRQKSYSAQGGIINTSRQADPNTSIELADRLTSRDIRRLGKGEFYMLRGDVKLLVIGPYIDDDSLIPPDKVGFFDKSFTNRLNHLIAIIPESAEDIAEKKSVEKYVKIILGESDDIFEKIMKSYNGDDEIGVIDNTIRALNDVDILESTCIGLARASRSGQAIRSVAMAAGRNGPMGGVVPGFMDPDPPVGPRSRGKRNNRVTFVDDQENPAPRSGGAINDMAARAVAAIDGANSPDDIDDGIAEAMGVKPIAVKRRRSAGSISLPEDPAPDTQGDTDLKQGEDKEDGKADDASSQSAPSEDEAEVKQLPPEKKVVEMNSFLINIISATSLSDDDDDE